jgi:hypothetical protein
MFRERSEDAAACPVCGDSLFNWVLATPTGTEEGGGRLLARCDTCGLGVNQEPPAPAEPRVGPAGDVLTVSGLERARSLPAAATEAAAELGPGAELTIRFPNRASLQASLGGPRWFELDAGSQRYLLAPGAVERLLRQRGLEVVSRRWLARASLVAMWQTALNSLTFHRDFAWRLVRRLPLGPKGTTLWLDFAITAIAALPVALLVLPLELGAALSGRGGVLELRARRPATP